MTKFFYSLKTPAPLISKPANFSHTLRFPTYTLNNPTQYNLKTLITHVYIMHHHCKFLLNHNFNSTFIISSSHTSTNHISKKPRISVKLPSKVKFTPPNDTMVIDLTHDEDGANTSLSNNTLRSPPPPNAPSKTSSSGFKSSPSSFNSRHWIYNEIATPY